MTIPGVIKVLEQSSKGHGQLSIASEARCEAEKPWRHHRTECGEWLVACRYHRNGAGGRTTVGWPCLLQPVYWRRDPCSLSSLLQPMCVQANHISGRLIPLWQGVGCCTLCCLLSMGCWLYQLLQTNPVLLSSILLIFDTLVDFIYLALLLLF